MRGGGAGGSMCRGFAHGPTPMVGCGEFGPLWAQWGARDRAGGDVALARFGSNWCGGGSCWWGWRVAGGARWRVVRGEVQGICAGVPSAVELRGVWADAVAVGGAGSCGRL